MEVARSFFKEFQQWEDAHLACDTVQFADGFNMGGCRELVAYEFYERRCLYIRSLPCKWLTNDGFPVRWVSFSYIAQVDFMMFSCARVTSILYEFVDFFYGRAFF